jgi:hypothetical protein
MLRRTPTLQKQAVRRLASDVALPEEARSLFTTAQMAVLAVIRDECANNSICRLIVPEIANRASVSATAAKRAIAIAKKSGVISVDIGQGNANTINTIVNHCIESWTAIHNAESPDDS